MSCPVAKVNMVKKKKSMLMLNDSQTINQVEIKIKPIFYFSKNGNLKISILISIKYLMF